MLPPHDSLAEASFLWGPVSAPLFSAVLSNAYSEVVHWRGNLFSVPHGNKGNQFVTELARLYRAYAEASALEAVALKATTVMCVLLLQRPHPRSQTKDHQACLSRRLTLWSEGDISTLLSEGRTIQDRLRFNISHPKPRDMIKSFSDLMLRGKVRDALRLLSKSEDGGLLSLADAISSDSNLTVYDVLESKHPPAQPPCADSLVCSDPNASQVHPVIFERIDADSIRRAVLRTFGAGGPSRMDAYAWRRLCTSFGKASNDLCHSLALVAKRVCSSHVHPEGLKPLLACRLIALDKNPGVRPIGICEVPRRIIAKATLSVIRCDVMEAVGPLQLCGGQIAGIEAAVHAVRSMFQSDECQGVLLVDASNAFNSLNRSTALLNIQNICPPISTILCNCYRSPSDLYVDGSVLLSREGTTQGDPLAMPMYALATVPLIAKLSEVDSVSQTWYADDASACGKLPDVYNWWNLLSDIGPGFGYFPNASKSWLVVKEEFLDQASEIFRDTNVHLTSDGRPYLGSPLGSLDYVNSFVQRKAEEWCEYLSSLSEVATVHPHPAYSAFTHGAVGWWQYLCRTTPDISHLLSPVESLIRTKLIPQLTGGPPPNDTMRHLLSLPVRLGGMGIRSPVDLDHEFDYSRQISGPLISCILRQDTSYSPEVLNAQLTAKSEVGRQRRENLNSSSSSLYNTLPQDLKRAVDLATEKGASSWLSTLPIQEHGFALHKAAFHDAVALRYGWIPSNVPVECACGKSFSVEHALSCAKGGFPSLRHNEVRDITASLISEVCSNVCTEPTLNPVSGQNLPASTVSSDGARLDVAADGFWGSRNERAFFDVRVFNPLAPSNSTHSIPATYKKHEREKKREYGARVREVEHGCFTPLVFSSTGGLGHEAKIVYKRLASLLSTKWERPYSSVLTWIRCCLSFSLLRSSIRCIRGYRSKCGFPVRVRLSAPIDVVNSETGL